MCLDPTVAWLLIVTDTPCLYVLPALALLDPAACVDQLWSLDDCTVVPVAAQGVLCAACWWHTFDGRHVAIVSTKVGELLFVDLLSRKTVQKVTTDIQVTELALLHDDEQMNTSLLMTGVSNGQWKLLLEARPQLTHFSPDAELSSMGYIDIDTRTIPPSSVLDTLGENSTLFTPEKVTQSQPWVSLTPQYARGRYFITAHDQKGATLQVYDSEGQHSPLFVYKLPPGAENVILTDRLTFTLSRRNGSQLLVLSNQRAETSTETLQDFNEDAVIQRLELPSGDRLLGASRRRFPFYWHDKQEELQQGRLRQGTVLEQPSMETVAMEPEAFAIPVTSHTVLDGCIVVTDTSVYECRPQASPERLFLQHAIVTSEMGVAEHLAISVGLDITMLAELAAHFLLKSGHISRAIRLFAVSKTKPGHRCSHAKRCASLARYGCIQEMLILLKHALQNQALELSSKERKVLADMLLYCYVHTVAHQAHNLAQTVASFKEFLLGSFSFDETVALDLLAEHGLTSLLLEFAMARGLVMDALGKLVTKGQLPVSLNFLSDLVTRGFSAHVLQAAQGGILCSLLGESVVYVLMSRPELIVQNAALLKPHLPCLDSPLLVQLAAILDPSQGRVKRLVQRQMKSLQRTSSLTSMMSFASVSSDAADIGQPHDVGSSSLSQILEVFLRCVLHLNHHRGSPTNSLTASDILQDPTHQADFVGEEEGHVDTGKRRLALQFSPMDCGTCHSAVIRDGDLYTWGRTKLGRLGHGDLVREGSVSTPACVQAFHLLQNRVEAVSCGGQHTLAITQQGVYGWGSSLYGQVGVGTRHVYHRPMLIETLMSESCVAVSCGQYHSLTLTADNQVYSWGWGVHGQLGHGDPEDRLTPDRIVHLNGRSVTMVAAGYCHSLVLTEAGEVWSFGCGYFGQLGVGSSHKNTLPTLVKALSEPITIISTKYFHSVAVTANNRVHSWGCHPHNLRYSASALRRSRQQGQTASMPTGDGTEMFHLPTLVDTTFIHSRVIQVCCGSLHTLLLTVDGEVFVYGRNLEGQLGTGGRQDERIPKMLTRINDQHMVYLCTGGEFNLALDGDFSLWVWGKNDTGQLGLVKAEAPTQARSTQGGQIQWRQSAVMTSDVVVPTPHRGLPSVNVHSQSWWYGPGSQMPTASINLVQWLEETTSRDECLYPLPNLQTVSTGDLLYQPKVIPIVVKGLGDYLDRSVILQHCVDQHDWFTAAHLCLLEGRHIQALCYRLMGLGDIATQIAGQSLTDLSLQVVSHHLRMAVDAGGNGAQRDDELTTLCTQTLNHWLQHELPIPQLQQLIEPHLSHLAPHLAMLLFRCQVPKQQGDDEDHQASVTDGQFYCHHFTAQFCLQVLSLVLSDQSPATDQFLNTWLQASLPTAESKRSGDGEAGDVFSGGRSPPLPLQSQSHLIPYQRLWQDIVRNVGKSSSSANTITLTRSQLDHLHARVTDGTDGTDGTSTVDAGAVVLFTCGHHYTQATFTSSVLSNTLEEISSSSHLASGKLPSTATLLQQYYTRQGLLPLACPKCVINVLRA